MQQKIQQGIDLALLNLRGVGSLIRGSPITKLVTELTSLYPVFSMDKMFWFLDPPKMSSFISVPIVFLVSRFSSAFPHHVKMNLRSQFEFQWNPGLVLDSYRKKIKYFCLERSPSIWMTNNSLRINGSLFFMLPTFTIKLHLSSSRSTYNSSKYLQKWWLD